MVACLAPTHTSDTDGTTGAPYDLFQARQHGLGNQIDVINGSGSWVEPGDDTSDDGDGYDDAGNMVYGPQPLNPTSHHVYKYDAWNRLTEVSDSSGTVATYSYDGLNRRVSKTVGSDTTHYYYNTNWQVLCEYLNDTYQLSYVWGLDYIDSPIQREEAGGTILQYLFDANRHITSLHDATNGGIVERYQYDPYGKVTVLHGASDADGAVTEWEKDTGGSDVDNEILFTGMRYDPETGLYHVRNRYWHFGLGRWTQEDKAGYVDGMNLYAGYFVMAGAMDPSGKKSWKNKDPLNISFLGVNPFGKAFDAKGLIDYWADHTFTSKDIRAAKKTINAYFDIDGDGRLTSKDCPPFKLGITGYSWGAWTALQLAHGLGKDFEIRMGLVDPIDTLRSDRPVKRKRRFSPRGPKYKYVSDGARFASKPPNVVSAVNYYQTLGCSKSCPGSSEWYRSQPIQGFDMNADMSIALDKSNAHVIIGYKWSKNASLSAHLGWK